MVIADTGLWLAIANRKDAYHQRAVAAVEAFGNERLIVTWPVMAKNEALPMDLADATLVLLAEWLGRGRILSSDRRDFGTYRLTAIRSRTCLRLGEASRPRQASARSRSRSSAGVVTTRAAR